MTDHLELVSRILVVVGETPDCELFEPAGQPDLPFALPEDLVAFYELCGGALLFGEQDGFWRVSGPQELVPAAPRLMTVEIAREIADEDPDGIATTSFVFADQDGMATDPHVVVDLHPSRAGRYYDTFWDRFGVVGNNPIVGLGVVDALHWLLDTRGEGPDDALERNPTFGDAYAYDDKSPR